MKPTKQNDSRSWIDIDLKIFSQNLGELKKYLLPHQSFLQVVKADAYGHGAYQIGITALEQGAVMLGVANVEEAFYLRFHKIVSPILILSPSLTSEIDLILEYDIIPSVCELEFCKSIDLKAKELNKKIPIHVKINTGMNRTGIKYNDIKSFFDDFSSFNNLYIEGLFSHFAASDDDESFSFSQYKIFCDCIQLFLSEEYNHLNHSLKYTHIANSSGLLFNDFCSSNKNFETSRFHPNLVRLGLMSYGYQLNENHKNKLNLEPVMSFKSKISHIGYADKGETIGYNRTYRAENDIKYAIIPIGYADGYDFLLSNKASVLLSKQSDNYLCKVLGKISMDMICIDVSEIPQVEIFDEVILLGNKPEEITALYLSNIFKGSVYELLCQLGRRAKRNYFHGENLVDNEPLQRRSFIPNDFTDQKLNNIIKKAIAHRINSDEISSVIYEDILKHIFIDSDRDITYRSNFKHKIHFYDSDIKDFYKVKTVLSFHKKLQNNEFSVVCANDNDKLQYYFQQKNCEYRWLLDKNLDVNDDNFYITKIKINLLGSNQFWDSQTGHDNICRMMRDNCLIYKFSDPLLNKFCGKEVNFLIETETLYPKKSHQLSVYINEITKGVEVSFFYPQTIGDMETTIIFSGKEKFPAIKRYFDDLRKINTIKIKTKDDTWVFPNSGIVFSF
ncbi:MAG: alanine racemase [Candidatus Cloacimonetes bacterium]|nr:alanine racemase [Candidatus Cloacimonadota bacterium]